MGNPFTSASVNFGLTGDQNAEQRRIDYERKLAEQLAADSEAPQGQMAGRIFVAPSWTQYLAKALNPMMARKQMDALDQRQKVLNDQRATDRADTLQAFSKALQGTPESVTPYQADNPFGEDLGDLKSVTPAVPGNRDAAMGVLAQSKDPAIQQLYMAQMLKGMEPGENFTLGQGQVRFGPDGKQIASVASKTEKPFIRTRIIGDQEVQEQLQSDGSYQEIGRGPRFARQVPSVVHVGADASGKPPSGYRYTKSGDLEAIPGGPADVKAQAVAQRQADGATDVDVALGTLREAYDRLDKGGGITSTKNKWGTNLAAAVSSSGIGQAAGKFFGTDNQSARNDIAMARPALLAALMKATGMSAKQMDSNAELKLWLSTATDPSLDVESNRRALANIERKYLKGGKPAAPSGGNGGWSDM